jgi:GT2 family glycosyltransferase
MPSGANLLIAIPVIGGIHPILVSRLLLWANRLPADRIHFYFPYKVAPVDRARNQAVRFFLTAKPAGKELTHMLFIDSDTIPPVNAIDRFFEADKHIVSGLTPIVSYDEKGIPQTYDNCFVARETDEAGKFVRTHVAKRHTGLKEVFRCGASCMLIAREVFEKLDTPHYRFVPNESNTEHVRSEDIDFCDRVRALGFRIYADTDVICQHSKEVLM